MSSAGDRTSVLDYETVHYQPSLRDDIIDLRMRVFGGTRAFNAAYIEWKYDHRPDPIEPPFIVTLHDGRVVSMGGSFGGTWRIGDSTLVLPSGGESAVDPLHRGHRLSYRRQEARRKALAETYPYQLGLSGNAASRHLGTATAGRIRVARYHTFRRGFPKRSLVWDESPPASSLLQRARRRVTRALAGFRSSEMTPHQAVDRWSAVAAPLLVTDRPRTLEMSQLAEQTRDANRVSRVKDERYYTWRFADPRSHYRFVYLDAGRRLDGFFVLQQLGGDGPINIVDWATTGPKVWDKLLHGVADAGIDRLEIRATVFTAAQERALLEEGFSPVFSPDTEDVPAPGVFLEPLGDSSDAAELGEWRLERLSDPDRWDIHMLDSDAY